MGYVMIQADDANATDYTDIYPAVVAVGYRMCSHIHTDNIGGGNSLTWAQCREMVTAGMLVASHGDAPGVLPTDMTDGELQTHLRDARIALIQNGCASGADYYAPISNAWDVSLNTTARACGVRLCRTEIANGGFGWPTGWTFELSGVADATKTDAFLQALITTARTTDNYLLSLTFHRIVALNPVGTQSSAARLANVITWIQAEVALGMPAPILYTDLYPKRGGGVAL